MIWVADLRTTTKIELLGSGHFLCTTWVRHTSNYIRPPPLCTCMCPVKSASFLTVWLWTHKIMPCRQLHDWAMTMVEIASPEWLGERERDRTCRPGVLSGCTTGPCQRWMWGLYWPAAIMWAQHLSFLSSPSLCMLSACTAGALCSLVMDYWIFVSAIMDYWMSMSERVMDSLIPGGSYVRPSGVPVFGPRRCVWGWKGRWNGMPNWCGEIRYLLSS